MRTAVVRVGVDRAGELDAAQLRDGAGRLRELAGAAGIELVDNDLAGLPPKRREVELLIDGVDPETLMKTAVDLCAKAFGTTPAPGW